MVSDNQFSKKSYSLSSNSFSDKSFSVTSNSFSDKSFSLTNNVWTGDNLTGGEYGIGDVFGGVDSSYGVGEYGGIAHFVGRTRYNVSH